MRESLLVCRLRGDPLESRVEGPLGEDVDSSEEVEKAPAEERAPHELVLFLAGLAAAACALASCAGAARGWTSPTLAVLYATAAVEVAVALGLAFQVMRVPERRLRLFVAGTALAGVAATALVGIFLLSGSI
jgi:hypothetical protein